MAWNPSPEVAVARDAAKQLDAQMCLVFWVPRNQMTGCKPQLGFATFGETSALCKLAKELGDEILKQGEELEAARQKIAEYERIEKIKPVSPACGRIVDL